MSTTGGTEQGTVLMLDEPDVIRKKIKSAVTDSGREVRRGEGKAGIANLIDDDDRRHGRAARGDRVTLRRRRVRRASKADVAEAVIELLEPIRSRYRELRDATRPSSTGLLAVGAEKARASSAPTLALMYERMGFARP